MSNTLYRQYDEDIVLYTEEYIEHVSAMTKENLDSKSDIAMELAARDLRIKELEDYETFIGECDIPCIGEAFDNWLETKERG